MQQAQPLWRNEWHLATCDVCRLLHGDTSPKVCFYCGACDSEICTHHQNDWPSRMMAAGLRKWENFRGVFT